MIWKELWQYNLKWRNGISYLWYNGGSSLVLWEYISWYRLVKVFRCIDFSGSLHTDIAYDRLKYFLLSSVSPVSHCRFVIGLMQKVPVAILRPALWISSSGLIDLFSLSCQSYVYILDSAPAKIWNVCLVDPLGTYVTILYQYSHVFVSSLVKKGKSINNSIFFTNTILLL